MSPCFELPRFGLKPFNSHEQYIKKAYPTVTTLHYPLTISWKIKQLKRNIVE